MGQGSFFFSPYRASSVGRGLLGPPPFLLASGIRQMKPRYLRHASSGYDGSPFFLVEVLPAARRASTSVFARFTPLTGRRAGQMVGLHFRLFCTCLFPPLPEGRTLCKSATPPPPFSFGTSTVTR